MGYLGFMDVPWGMFAGGAIIAGGVVWLVLWLRGRDIKVTWYEWLIAALGILLIAFGFQNMFSAIREFEYEATWRFLLVFSLPGLILLAVAAQLVRRRKLAS